MPEIQPYGLISLNPNLVNHMVEYYSANINSLHKAQGCEQAGTYLFSAKSRLIGYVALKNQKSLSQRIVFLDDEFRLATVIGMTGNTGGNGIVFAGFGFGGDEAREP